MIGVVCWVVGGGGGGVSDDEAAGMVEGRFCFFLCPMHLLLLRQEICLFLFLTAF